MVRSVDPRWALTRPRLLDIASTPEAAEQAAADQVQANKWKGDWVPIEVSPTTGAAIPYTKEGETTTRPNQHPPVWEGLRFLLTFPEDPSQVSLELAEQLLGLRPRPRFSCHVGRPQEPLGAQWLDPGAVVEPGVLPAGPAKPAVVQPNSPNAQAWVAEL